MLEQHIYIHSIHDSLGASLRSPASHLPIPLFLPYIAHIDIRERGGACGGDWGRGGVGGEEGVGSLGRGGFQFCSQEPHGFLLIYYGYRWFENFAIICTISRNYGISIYLVRPRSFNVYSLGENRRN